eukprot:11180855-Lingulodinium_polyedra.AAC.1
MFDIVAVMATNSTGALGYFESCHAPLARYERIAGAVCNAVANGARSPGCAQICQRSTSMWLRQSVAPDSVRGLVQPSIVR